MVVSGRDPVFDDLRRLSRIAGFDDHLYIREIRQGVYRVWMMVQFPRC